MVKTLGLNLGKVVIAQTDRSTLRNTSTVPYLGPYQSIINNCVNEDKLGCKSHLEDVQDPAIEELSSHPVHLVNKQGELMPSAFIPYCGFLTDMAELGKQRLNFSSPLCNAFTPVLLKGQLCYELDTDRIQGQVKHGLYGGLFLMLDTSLDRSFTVERQSAHTYLSEIETTATSKYTHH